MTSPPAAPMPDTPASDLRQPPTPLVLGSTSRYRAELLARLRYAFETVAPGVDESPLAGELPAAAARRLALEKARSVAERRPEAIVIGSDQTATIDGVSIIGKPGDHRRAVAQLEAASGRALSFHTALCVIAPQRDAPAIEVVTTVVRFRVLALDEIETYLALERPYDCAGAAKAEGLGISLIESIDGSDPTALIGLPLVRLCAFLRDCGLRLPG